MAQYPIPQFIEQEGKIISFLTFRQFFILIGGGVVCLLCYYLLPFFLFLIVAAIVGLLVVSIAFLKIDGAPAIKLLLNLISFSFKSKNYVWKKKEMTYPFRDNSVQAPDPAEPQNSRLQTTKKIIELHKRK